MSVTIFAANTKAKAAEVNDNFAFIASDRLIGFDSSTGAALSEFDIGDLTEITNGTLVNDILAREGGLFKTYNDSGSLQRTKDLSLFQPSQGSTLTIASGVVTITADQHTIASEVSSSADTLTTINGGTDGQIIIISPNDATNEPITIDHSTGNIKISTDSNIILNDADDRLTLQYDGSSWIDISRSINSDFLSSTSTNGYTYSPNGIITQWGTKTIAGITTDTITLPVTYPSTHLVALATLLTDSATNDGDASAVKFSTSQIKVRNDSGVSLSVQWFSLGI